MLIAPARPLALPANAQGDDIIVYADESRTQPIATFHTRRHRLEKREGRFNAALSDFTAPMASGVPDTIGAFVVTADIGEDIIADRPENANDDYCSSSGLLMRRDPARNLE